MNSKMARLGVAILALRSTLMSFTVTIILALRSALLSFAVNVILVCRFGPARSHINDLFNNGSCNSPQTKLQQTLREVPVYGAQLVAEQRGHDRRGFTGSWMGVLVKDIERLNFRPSYSGAQAVEILKRMHRHHVARLSSAIRLTELLFPQLFTSRPGRALLLPVPPALAQLKLLVALSAPALFQNEEATLYLFVDSRSKTHLAYRATYFIEPLFDFSEYATSSPSRPVGFIDAHTGEIIDSWDDQPSFWCPKPTPTPPSPPSVWRPGTIHAVGGNSGRLGKQLYTDLNVSMTKDASICSYNTSLFQVQNMNGATRGSFAPAIFECDRAALDSYDFVNNGYSPLNDAARNTEITVRMYQTYTGHDGPQDVLPLKARVHYGRNYQNAYWDGRQMTIGDGGKLMYPLTSLDIVAHEYGHAFTTSNANLEYRRQSGGINEAFSDMSGEAAKFFSNGTNDFIVGGDVMKNVRGLRYMCDPPLDGKSIGNASLYTDSMDVHYSSGVYNKAFCILAQTGNWTTETAFRTFARANDLYWGPKTDFSWGACGVKEAAVDLGYNVDDVVAAFAKVEVVCKKCKMFSTC